MVRVNGEHWKVLIKDTASVPGYDISLCKCVICLLSWGHFWRHQTQTLFFFQIGFRSDKLRIMNLVWSFILPQPQDVPELLMLLIASFFWGDSISYFHLLFENICQLRPKGQKDIWGLAFWCLGTHLGIWAGILVLGNMFRHAGMHFGVPGVHSGMPVNILVHRYTFGHFGTQLAFEHEVGHFGAGGYSDAVFWWK